MGVFLRHGTELVEMREQPYEAEAVLQRLLADYPSLLAGDAGGDDRDRRWLFIKREVGIASAVGHGDRWSLDHLFLDQQGVPTLVEVKRSTDSRIRREVVGQMLDYAANATAYWSPEKIQAIFEARCQAEGLDPEEQLLEALGLESNSADFWEQVRTNLDAGKLRLVFVADLIPDELQRVIEFMNEQMSSTEVLALEVKQYVEKGGERQTLVSRVIGQTAVAKQRKSTSAQATTWGWDEYAEIYPETQIEVARELARKIDEAVADRALDLRPEFLRWAIPYKRPGGYNVIIVVLRVGVPVRLGIRLPQEPSTLGLENPYPGLVDRWEKSRKRWSWDVPSTDELPDVGAAIDIALPFQPERGPMAQPGILENDDAP